MSAPNFPPPVRALAGHHDASAVERLESNVRGYCRLFPTVFSTAKGSTLVSRDGRYFIDFFCGAGSLNYGHNPEGVKQALLEYVGGDGILHSLDTVTEAKLRFLESFEQIVLRPRGLDYKVQFTGPTGTNAVEAALKLARKATGRGHVVAFTHAYHGHSLGSLAATANQAYHCESYGSHNNVTHLPFDGYVQGLDSAALLRRMIEDPSSGLPKPAAVILETVQGEGGVNVASDQWLRDIENVCRDHGILLIVDDIQVGNGRTGKFFSFEHAGIRPDLVCLSKSIGGGLPMSLLLIGPERDVWQPGEHTGTFRGNNLAFIAAAAVLDHWREPAFEREIARRGVIIEDHLCDLVDHSGSGDFSVRGRGMIWGLDLGCGELASSVIRECFRHGLLIESSGANDEVLKVMPALTIDRDLLCQGLTVLRHAVRTCLSAQAPAETKPVAVMAAPITIGLSESIALT